MLVPAKGEETDRRLRVIEAPSYGIVGKTVTLRVAIEDLGVAHPAPSANLTIRRDGEPPRVENVPIGAEQRIELPITRAGPTVVELSATPLAGEVSTINNRAVVEINGVRDRLARAADLWRAASRRAHLAAAAEGGSVGGSGALHHPAPAGEGRPYAAERAGTDRFPSARAVPRQDPRVRPDHPGPVPEPRPAADALHRQHRRPCARGRCAAAERRAGVLRREQPGSHADRPGTARRSGVDDSAVVEGQFRPRVTDLGQRHPVTEGLTGANPPGNPDAAAEWGSWYRRIQPADVHGEVLLGTRDSQPLLLLDRVGKGRVALLLSDQIWLWSRGHQGGGPQAELLRRVAHWLMQEPELEENALTAHVADGRLSIERRSIDPAPPGQVTVTDPDGKTQTLDLTAASPGKGTASLPATTPGVWQASDGARTAYAAAGAANPPEFADLRATATLLRKLVRASGGAVHFVGTGTPGAPPDVPDLRRTEPDRPAAGSSWIGLERRHDHVVTGVSSLTLLPAWIALPLMLGLLVLGWQREGT